jgi:uncharacterized protein YhaN
MIIKKLYLQAFGPFSDQVLDFNCAKPGLHIIYGPNEAGKSSSLRALNALLYGFPERTSDNFIHANKELVVSGTLQKESGGELTFSRRKRRKNDLLDMDGNPLPANVLQPFLHAVDQQMFTALYSINHDDLVAGGREILAGGGEAGQALFSAGSGIVSLKKVLDSLDGEADFLFKARGSVQEINKLINRHKALSKEIRMVALPGRKWRELRDELRKNEEKAALLEARRAERDKERRYRERLLQALPHLALRRDLQEKIKNFGPVVILADDFSKSRRDLETKLHAARQQHKQAQTRLAELRGQNKDLSFSAELLAQDDLIDQLYRDLGSYSKAMTDRPRLDGMRISHRRRAGELLQQMPPDLTLEQVEILRPLLGRRTGIQTMAAARETLNQQLKDSTARLEALKQELDKIAETFEPVAAGETDSLLQAVKSARKAGDIDKLLAEKKTEMAELRQRCDKELQGLTLWDGDIFALARLPLPLAATVRRFARDYQNLDNLLTAISRDQEKIQEKSADTICEINKLQNAGEVLGEEDLKASRRIRDHGWELIRGQWLQGNDINEASRAYDELPLAAAYEKNVKKADSLADRLRREADRVQQFAALQAEEQGCRDMLAQLSRKQQDREAELTELERRWQAVWQECRIKPLPPEEMLAWLHEVEKIKPGGAELDHLAGQIADLSKDRQILRQALIRELAGLKIQREFSGDELEPVISYCETVLEEINRQNKKQEQAGQRRRDLRIEVEAEERKLRQIKEELDEWRKSWQKVWSVAHWSGDISPLEANDFLADLVACFTEIKEADDLQKRIDGINRDAEQLKETTDSVVTAIAPDLRREDLKQKIIKLHTRLSRAREQQNLSVKNSKEIKKAVKKEEQTRGTLATLEARMADLRRQAGCSLDTEFDEAEQRSRQFLDLQEELTKTEKLLIQSSPGLDLEKLSIQAREQDADELPGIISRLGREIDSFDVELRSLAENIGEKKKELSRMDGSSKAADLAAEAAEILARINRLARRYVLLKSSGAVLRREIERFRRENQDPVVKIASGYFRSLTLESFTALEVDEDDRGQPALGGVREGKWVDVGAMSSGTRDQLYLSLRLASLEHQHEAGPLPPFIVDDILINFDDARGAATLKALAGLAEKIQVILFTHHRQIIAAAEKIGRDDIVKIYNLAGS